MSEQEIVTKRICDLTDEDLPCVVVGLFVPPVGEAEQHERE